MKRREIWIWRRMVTPHVAALATGLADMGHSVVYVCEELISAQRKQQGWDASSLGGAVLRVAGTAREMEALAAEAPAEAVHVCQGLRGNGHIASAQKELSRRRIRQWIAIESIDDRGLLGFLRRIEYRRLLMTRKRTIEAILAIGYKTPAWLSARGAADGDVYPFTYFLHNDLEDLECNAACGSEANSEPFRLVFVGRLVRCKRVDLLISALAGLPFRVELEVIGGGELEGSLRRMAVERNVAEMIRWVGGIPIRKVPPALLRADCLVLPSDHDGWGAVISEALLVGTPAICSEACGAASVVAASGVGAVFATGSAPALRAALEEVIRRGRISPQRRRELAAWATCLSGASGARYLTELVEHRSAGRSRPEAPWVSAAGGR